MFPSAIIPNRYVIPMPPSYEDFLVYKNQMISSGAALEKTNMYFDKINPAEIVNPLPVFYQYVVPTGIMYGSSFRGIHTTDSPIARSMQHALPPHVYDDILTRQLVVMFEYAGFFTWSDFYDKTINGYYSQRFTRPWQATKITKIVYFDHTKNMMMYYNPSLEGSVPEEYIFKN